MEITANLRRFLLIGDMILVQNTIMEITILKFYGKQNKEI